MWAQVPGTAVLGALDARVIAAGPGWEHIDLDRRVTRAGSIRDGLRAVD